MIQEEDKHDLRHKILLISQIKVKTETQSNFVQTIVPSNENQAFIYYDNGAYEIYNLESPQIIGNGNIPSDVEYFTQIYLQTLCFLDPEDMKVKLLDLKTLNQQFSLLLKMYLFKEVKKKQQQTLAEQFRIMSLDRDQEKIKYLITQYQEKYNSNKIHVTSLLESFLQIIHLKLNLI